MEREVRDDKDFSIFENRVIDVYIDKVY